MVRSPAGEGSEARTVTASVHAQVEERAAAWLIRMDSGEVTPAEADDLKRWLDADPRHRVAYLRLQVAWRKAGRWALQPAGEPGMKRTGRLRWPVALAASLTVMMAGGMWWVHHSGVQTYVTAVGASERISLPDGSRVILNTNSRVRMRFDERQRVVQLLRGEAHFTVASDPLRPFSVQAAQTTVRAVGTAFSVRLREEERQVDVLVTEGRVALSPGSELGAGEAAVIRPEGLRVNPLPAAELPRRLAWQEGLLRFNGETLVEAVAEFNRYNRRQLTIIDPAIAGLRVGGGFQTTDIDSFLGALQRSFGIRVRQSGDDDSRPIQLLGAAPPSPPSE